MFTGIVEELGVVAAIDIVPGGARVEIQGPLICSDAAPDDSIAVNGVCLTVTELASKSFRADVMAETLTRSSLGRLRLGSPVNLERATTLSTRLGGHMVQGHVDGVATLAQREVGGSWHLLRFKVPQQLARYIVEKGSIALDGVSLTVIAVTDLPRNTAESPITGHNGEGFASVEIGVIPATLRHTTLGALAESEQVNVEVDVIAKYVERLLGANECAEFPRLGKVRS
ncbi:MAG: riboflavin synthase [Acidimicrobiales bacterium]|nr:MAG: riboflavin synthase [Acidimicrobiales bacterium]